MKDLLIETPKPKYYFKFYTNAIFILNYQIGVLRHKPTDFSTLNDAACLGLVGNIIYIHPGINNSRDNELVDCDEAVFCYIQDRNVFWCTEGVYQYCNTYRKTGVRCKPGLLLNRYHFGSSNRIGSHSYKKLDNEYTEIRIQLSANKFILIYKCILEIISYLLSETVLLTRSFEITQEDCRNDFRAPLGVIKQVEMHKRPVPLLKEVYNEENNIRRNNIKEIKFINLNFIE
ncbi:hypothetical protein CWI38_0162p0080 [Hamiltosporidium tvaerminnensis]|uniref:Uncharacterized protein n=1 Tax=Hamiltosporidium tvaerminnensis TaxID=1176355 RepID=A0A4Q9M061_9MICR|nr:hypothetical protein CWI38_0162p0080 [Hamiltosporidium tvaerminnensis]